MGGGSGSSRTMPSRTRQVREGGQRSTWARKVQADERRAHTEYACVRECTACTCTRNAHLPTSETMPDSQGGEGPLCFGCTEHSTQHVHTHAVDSHATCTHTHTQLTPGLRLVGVHARHMLLLNAFAHGMQLLNVSALGMHPLIVHERLACSLLMCLRMALRAVKHQRAACCLVSRPHAVPPFCCSVLRRAACPSPGSGRR